MIYWYHVSRRCIKSPSPEVYFYRVVCRIMLFPTLFYLDTVDSVSIYAFPESFTSNSILNVIQYFSLATGCFFTSPPSDHWVSVDRGMNPVAMTITNSRRKNGQAEIRTKIFCEGLAACMSGES